jgi:2-polyprenyl-3-methyl-5-hydroxy-6-metoxy-1,4-benzoquinol methylase
MLAASHGAEAMGVDVAELAIERARAKAQQRGISAMFDIGDVLHLDRLGCSMSSTTRSARCTSTA